MIRDAHPLRWAERLRQARAAAEILPADAMAELSLEEAHAVQDEVVRLSRSAGARVAGWKIGLTSPEALAAFGAAEPMVGRIFADTILADGAVLAPSQTCQPRIEGEILIEIGERPAAGSDDEALLASIRSVRPAIEVADSRIRGWPTRVAPATADDACCGWLVAGAPREPGGIDLAAAEMGLRADDVLVSSGRGANCMGGAIQVYRWFLQKAEAAGWQLEPGHLILTGAMGPAVPARAGMLYEASVAGLGTISLSFAEKVT